MQGGEGSPPLSLSDVGLKAHFCVCLKKKYTRTHTHTFRPSNNATYSIPKENNPVFPQLLLSPCPGCPRDIQFCLNSFSNPPPRPVQSTGQSLKMRKCIHGTVRKRIWVEALVLVSVPDLEVFIQLPSSVTPSCSHYPQPRCGWLWQYADKCLTINSLGKKIFVVNFTDIKDV